MLGSDPAALFAFVRNTIEFQSYFGSLKGAQGTLLEQAGNDIDQASLLIALLRASGVPARYVAGVVKLPIAKVMNWVGVRTPQAAVEAIASNGIPSVARTSADGTITHLVFFHVWAEAFLPQGPGRGAASRCAWVPLDPGFKQHDFTAGIDLTRATYPELTEEAQKDVAQKQKNADKVRKIFEALQSRDKTQDPSGLEALKNVRGETPNCR